MNKEFERLCNKCPRLRDLLSEQQADGLPKDKWASVIRLLIDSGRIALAKEFSRQSEKHNYESEAYIDELSMQKKMRSVRCTELGCTQEDIESLKNRGYGCFGGDPCVKNMKGVIVNSPASLMCFTTEEQEKIGFFFKEDKDGEPTDEYGGMNPNVYVRHILKNYKLMYHESERYYIYMGYCWKTVSDFRLQKTLRFFFDKFAPDVWRMSIQSQYFNTLRYECYDIKNLRTAENYINVKNGLLNLGTEEMGLEPHNEMIFTTTQIPIMYDSNADCSEFQKFLSTIFQGKKQLKLLVQEIMGYCLSSSIKAHKMFIFFGDGNNGKSVLTDVMTALAGGDENVSNIPIEDLNKKFSLAQIADKTLNISTENKVEITTNTQILKAIVAGDPIQMEEKHQAAFSYRPFVKLVFSMNEMPYFADKSYGLQRRLQFVPFNVRVVDHEPRSENEVKRDPYLSERLIKNELPGILAFAIEGLKRLRDNNYIFTVSKRADKLFEEVKETSNPYLAFVRVRIVADKDASRLKREDVVNAFQRWCAQEGHTKLKNVTSQKFWSLMKNAFRDENIPFIANKGDKKRFLDGIKIKYRDDDDEETTLDELFYF
jgi:putative DNA primase/helicase